MKPAIPTIRDRARGKKFQNASSGYSITVFPFCSLVSWNYGFHDALSSACIGPIKHCFLKKPVQPALPKIAIFINEEEDF
jgi:hypothetical protein